MSGKENLNQATEKATGLFAEFKKFISRGNVMDLAVGVVIGGAFTAIVTALVSDIITPIITVITGSGVNFAGLTVGVFPIGDLIMAIINFILIAFVVFLMVKAVNKLNRKKETPAAPPAPSKEEVLLTEIRDLLKEQNRK